MQPPFLSGTYLRRKNSVQPNTNSNHMHTSTHMTTLSRPLRHRRATITTAPPPDDGYDLTLADTSVDDSLLFLTKPAGFLIHQLDLALSTLASVVGAFLSLFSHSKASAEEAPAKVARGGATLVKKLSFGILGAAYACFVLVALLVLAVVIGVGLVGWWVEEPISMRKPLYFDYTEDSPSAVAAVGGAGRGRTARAVPVGHSYSVSLELLLPESDYNRQIGIFQVTAESTSSTGETLARSGQPCMLRFRSAPVRLMRTFIMGVPLILGLSCETQTLTVDLLRHKERLPRTEAIKITLRPRAGTLDLPQLYAADLILKSQLPWRKQLAYNWKWTFYVWISLYVYVMLLLFTVCCFRPFRLPWWRGQRIGHPPPEEVEKEDEQAMVKVERDVSDEFEEAVRRFRSRSRRKRKLVGSGAMVPADMSDESRSEVIDESGDFPWSESSECVDK